MPQTALFSDTDLTNWLGRTVSSDRAEIAEKVVWGWLSPILELDDRPDTVSPQLFSWAVELGGIAYVNPENLSRYRLDSELSEYSSERRDEILRAAASGGVVPPGAAAKPVGSFPPARCYPDPAGLITRNRW